MTKNGTNINQKRSQFQLTMALLLTTLSKTRLRFSPRDHMVGKNYQPQEPQRTIRRQDLEDSSGENGNGASGVAICKEANIPRTVLLKEQNKESNGQLSQTPILYVFEKNIYGKKWVIMECTSISCLSREALKLFLNDGLWKALIVRYRISLPNVPFSDDSICRD